MRDLIKHLLVAGTCLGLSPAAFAQSTTPTIPGGGSQNQGGALQGTQGSTQPPINGANRNPTVQQGPTGTVPPGGATIPGAVGVPVAGFGSISQSPYFQEQALRTQLGLTPEQYARLAAAYAAAYGN